MARESRKLSKQLAAVFVGAALVVLVGCASPGPPLPPSLKLPQVVTDLSASRVGDRVVLHWTTPARTTDKLLITGNVTVEICRDIVTGGEAVPTKASAKMSTRNKLRKPLPTTSSPVVCTRLQRTNAAPGASEFVDTLPRPLLSGAAQVLAYRVELLNAAGRTAGPSAAATVASGPSPRPIRDLRATATKRGVVLEWAEDGVGGKAETIEFDRIAEHLPAADPTAKGELPVAPKEQTETRLQAGGPTGTVDRTALPGRTYRYAAQRVQTVSLGGRTLEVLSLPSDEVTVKVPTVFPPEAPVALVAVPGFAGEGDAQKATIDLSWDPNMEPHLAGYRVYRRDLDGNSPEAWKRLRTDMVRVASFRDPMVIAGKRYAYRVAAVNDAGDESTPSGEVTETAPTP